MVFLLIQFFLHLAQCFLLSLFSDMSFELFTVNLLLQHCNLVLVVVFYGFNHFMLLVNFLDFVFFELFLFFEKFVFFKVACQFIYFFAEPYLLSVPLEHLTSLLVNHLFFKLALFDCFNSIVSSLTLLLNLGTLHSLLLGNLLLKLIFFQKVCELLLLFGNSVISFIIFLFSHCKCSIVTNWRTTLRLLT